MTSTLPATGARASSLRRGRPKQLSRRRPIAYAFVAPALALIVIFQLYPIVNGLMLSVHEWSGVSEEQPYIGADNYLSIFQDSIFWTSLRNAFTFGIVGVVAGGSLALGVALLVNARPQFAGLFRAILFLPWMLSPVVFGYLWAWILDPNVGPLNKLLSGLTGGTVSFAWLATPGLTLWVVAFVFVWAHWSFGFLIFLSGLQSVPSELTEAAQLDGANGRQQFRYIVWPIIAPVAVVVSVVSLLLAMQIFGTVFVLTNGGPGYSTQVPTLLIYQEAFVNFRVGRAAAMSVIFGLVLVMCSGLQVFAARRWSDE